MTPWLVAVWHTPWYTSNAHHPMSEGTPMREAMEAVLPAARVDIVFNGHVYASERTHPMLAEKVDAHGIPYVTIGDGSNREKFATPWVTEQPAWSAIRENPYGYGLLEISGADKAQWWLRNPDSWNPTPGAISDSCTLTH